LLNAGSGGRPIIGVANATVNIRGLTVDGMNLAENSLFLVGAMYVNADGVIQDNLIRNIGFGAPTLPLDPQGFPIYQGDPIVVVSFLQTPRTVTIMKNRLVNFNNNGITGLSFGDPNIPGSANLTMDVVRNTIVGLGPNDLIDQFGMFFLSDGFADPSSFPTVTIRDNHIRDFATIAPYPLLGSGIVTANMSNLELSNNEVENADVGIEAAFSYNAQILRNRLTGTGMDSSGSVGIPVSGSEIEINQNRIRNFETGIVLHVFHPFFGPASAVNTSLNNNQFGNVGVEITTGSGVIGMQAGAAPAYPRSQSYRLRLQP
jgi:hypothetical protein